jgi:hypothetical protein
MMERIEDHRAGHASMDMLSATQAPAGAGSVYCCDEDPQGDLHFVEMRILGELAWVRNIGRDMFSMMRNPEVESYIADLQTRRNATPKSERVLRVQAPHVPSVPEYVLRGPDSNGWQTAPTALRGLRWHVGDGYCLDGRVAFQETLVGGEGDWFVTTHQRDDVLTWLVLSRGGGATIREEDGAFSAVFMDSSVKLERRGTGESETPSNTSYRRQPASGSRS